MPWTPWPSPRSSDLLILPSGVHSRPSSSALPLGTQLGKTRTWPPCCRQVLSGFPQSRKERSPRNEGGGGSLSSVQALGLGLRGWMPPLLLFLPQGLHALLVEHPRALGTTSVLHPLGLALWASVGVKREVSGICHHPMAVGPDRAIPGRGGARS